MGSYWQSDDFIAIHHVQNWSRVVADFAGAQYGLEGLVLFYRPLITLSFAFDAMFGDYAPFVSHFGNALIHAGSAVCLAKIAIRFLPNGNAFAAGLVWGLAPCAASSVFWAVGRVDSHTTLWIALSTLFFVQWCRGERSTRTPSLLCFLAALGSKELAIVMPGIAAVMAFAVARRETRARAVVHATTPYFVILALYFGWRFWLFGSPVGGYEGALDIGASLRGLGYRTLELLNPLIAFEGDWWRPVVGFIPLIGALIGIAMTQRTRLPVVLLVLYLGCCVPTIQIWADTGNPKNLRNFYLAMMPVAVFFANWGWWSAGPALALFLIPLWGLRVDYQESWQRCAAWHARIEEQLGSTRFQDPLFVAGLPRENSRGTALEFHLGVDRLGFEPFRTGRDVRTVHAMRPMLQHPARYEIPYGELHALPFGKCAAGDQHVLLPVTRPPRTADLACRWDGPIARSTETWIDLRVLDQMVANFKRAERGEAPVGKDPRILLPGTRSKVYRVTLFTAGGYLTTFVPDTAPADAKDGEVQVGLILYGHLTLDQSAGAPRLGDQLQIATTLDRHPSFPVLIEADLRPEFSGDPKDFVPTHATTRPIALTMPRGFASWWP